ncbi:MAG: hypothetical protein HUJ76_08390 [Parasporobacterium sp.]|nr:hypothetical protein [Parasporobacterium sp.]
MGSGGARPDSGRKAIPEEEKRVQLCITIAPVTRERLHTIRDRGHKIGPLIDELVEQYCRQ